MLKGNCCRHQLFGVHICYSTSDELFRVGRCTWHGHLRNWHDSFVDHDARAYVFCDCVVLRRLFVLPEQRDEFWVGLIDVSL